MAAYAQFGYGGFPSASQLLPSGTQTHNPDGPDAPALSPTGNDCPASSSAANLSHGSGNGGGIGGGGDASSVSALSPDALSQHSNANATGGGGGGGATTTTTTTGGSLDGSTPATTGGSGGGGTAGGGGNSCCENGRPIMTDPVSGQTVCSCQYDTARLALSSYSRLPAASVGVYGAPYPSTDQNPYQSIGVDSSAFYAPLSNPYALKDSAGATEMGAWTSAGLQPTTGYYSYDPMSAYGYGASYDLAARRKNATRESTATLKAWLNEHKKNPYPTKGEKIMLAIITKMTLTQVSTWFANARRRLKKENKMTWEPKNRTDDDDDALVSDDEKDKDGDGGDGSTKGGQNQTISKDAVGKDEDELTDEDQKIMGQTNILRAGFGYASGGYHSGGIGGGIGGNGASGYHPYHHPHHQHPAAYYQQQQQQQQSAMMLSDSESKNQLSRDCGVPIPATKPKIWSLADTVGCKTPPPPQSLPLAPLPLTTTTHQQQSQPLPLPPSYMGVVGNQGSLHMQPPTTGLNMAMTMSMNMGQDHPHHHQSQQQQQQQHQQLQHQQHQHQQQQQHQQQSQQIPFSGAPYLRAHTTAYGGFLGATTQQLHTTNNVLYNNNNSSSNVVPINHNSNNNAQHNSVTSSSNTNSSSNSSQSSTPTIPTITGNPLMHHQQQQQQQQQQQMSAVMRPIQSVANQRAMGFPEAQPDTPPQTPPNMKHSNNNNSSSHTTSGASTVGIIGTQAPMIATCRTINNTSNTTTNFACNNSNNNYPMNFSTRFGDYSPRDECSSGSNISSNSNSSSSSSLSMSPHEVNFKPIFKRDAISIAGFVPPV